MDKGVVVNKKFDDMFQYNLIGVLIKSYFIVYYLGGQILIIQKILNYDVMLFRGRDYNNYKNNFLQYYIFLCFVCYEECVIVFVLLLYLYIVW